MNRRNFLSTLIGGVAASAAVRTWPFRVYSFPSTFNLYEPQTLPDFIAQYSNELAELLSGTYPALHGERTDNFDLSLWGKSYLRSREEENPLGLSRAPYPGHLYVTGVDNRKKTITLKTQSFWAEL